MKGKDIRTKHKAPKDRRTGRKLNDKLLDNVTGGADTPTDSNYKNSFGDEKYRIKYKGKEATIILLDGSNHTATYNSYTHEWYGDVSSIPDGQKRAIEGFYNNT